MNKQIKKMTYGLLGILFTLGISSVVQANPEGDQVVAGQATIQQESPTKLGITQSSDKAIINWQQFNIAPNEHTQFYQPSKRSITLNRVVSDDPSKILGKLTANGQIMLINQNGILFGRNAQIDVAGLVASTHGIRNEDFLSGKYEFTLQGKLGAAIINEGNISIADQGIAAFVASSVQNDGLIFAKLGKVALVAGNGFTLDFYGDGLVNLVVDDKVAQTAMDLEGNRLESFVDNSGKIEAQGGYVLLTANAARGAVNSVISHSGEIEATSVSEQNGKIVLYGGDAGIVEVSGTLDTSSDDATGGDIQITGNKVGLLADSHLDASGKTSGGTILVGGDYQGKGDTPTAQVTYVDSTASIKADATDTGNGGKVIVWSDDTTRAYGSISARGGLNGGDGGFIEVSGKKFLDVEGVQIAANALNGENGTVLFDPADVYIVDKSRFYASNGNVDFFTPSSENDTFISAYTIERILNNGNNVKITTYNYLNDNASGGDIHVKALITKSAGGDAALTLLPNVWTYFYNNSGIQSLSGKLDINILPYAVIGGTHLASGVKLITNGGIIHYGNSNPIEIYNDLSDPSPIARAPIFINHPVNAPFLSGCQSPGCIYANGSIINTGNASGSLNTGSSYTRITVENGNGGGPGATPGHINLSDDKGPNFHLRPEVDQVFNDYAINYVPAQQGVITLDNTLYLSSNSFYESNRYLYFLGKTLSEIGDDASTVGKYTKYGAKKYWGDMIDENIESIKEFDKKTDYINELYASGEQGKASSVAQKMGAYVEIVGDVGLSPILNNNIIDTAKYVVDKTKIKDGVKYALTAGVIDDYVVAYVNKALDTEIGQKFIAALEKGEVDVKKWAEENPEAIRNLDAIISISEIIGVTKGVTKTIKTIKHIDNSLDANKVNIDSGCKGAWCGELNKPEPNKTYYVDDNYSFDTDGLGRTKKVEGRLDLNTKNRNKYQQRETGKSGSFGDEGGHLIASIFDGPGERLNLVPMNGKLNRGEWRNLESEWAKAIKGGKPVKVKIEAVYTGDSVRPDSFKVQYSVGNGKTIDVELQNTPNGK